MATNDTIEELRGLNSLLAEIPKMEGYTVPGGFFENFAIAVLTRIKAEKAANAGEELNFLSPFLNNISREIPYSTPGGYFDNLEEKIMNGIREHADYQDSEEELQHISSLLSSISKKTPYSAPEGYFEKFAKDFTPSDTKSKPAKVISFTHRKWPRYLAAAVLIGAIATTSIFVLIRRKGPNISNSYAWVKKSMYKISTDDINNFIRSTDGELSQKGTIASAPANSGDINDLLKDVSNKEIKKFLDETSGGTGNNGTEAGDGSLN
jgi:hypothetical protein